jgi:Flp pilus assembly pilin Flp
MQEPTVPTTVHTAPALSPLRRSTLSFRARFVADETGSDLIEYVLLAFLLGLTAVFSIGSLGNKIAHSYNSVGTSMTNAV